MPRARRKRDRLHQVHRWLRRTYSTPFPTLLRVEQLPHGGSGFEGETYLQRGRLMIRVHKNRPLWIAVEILLHEYAHAMTWRHAKIECLRGEDGGAHDDEFGLAYARLYRHYYHMGGAVEADDE